MKNVIVISVLILLVAGSAGAWTAHYGWEDNTATVLGLYGDGDPPIICTLGVSPGDPVSEGTYSLKLERNSAGTPQAFVAHVWGLQDGDEVLVYIDRYDDTPAAAPSARLWGHWNDELPDNVEGYSGSAGGNSDYGGGMGWDTATHTWTVVDGHVGLAIEIRVYSNPGDVILVDNMLVNAPDHAWIQTPEKIYVPDGSVIPVDAATWGGIKALFR